MNCCIEGADAATLKGLDLCPISIQQHQQQQQQPKIPRPPNAFMLYANEHRKTLAHLYPADSNKEISRRLGQSWKDLSLPEKNRYFQRAKDIDQEHKRKYPGYVYNPKDARVRKAIRGTLRDRSIGASPLLARPALRKNEFLQVIMPPPPARLATATSSSSAAAAAAAVTTTAFDQTISPMWNALCCDLSLPPLQQQQQQQEPQQQHKPEEKNEATTSTTMVPGEERDSFEVLPPVELEELKKEQSGTGDGYLPISATKFVTDPELYTNNVEYHKEYIIKYFNHIPDYETYNVTTEEGETFPYVTIPNFIMRQNVNRMSYHC